MEALLSQGIYQLVNLSLMIFSTFYSTSMLPFLHDLDEYKFRLRYYLDKRKFRICYYLCLGVLLANFLCMLELWYIYSISLN